VNAHRRADPLRAHRGRPDGDLWWGALAVPAEVGGGEQERAPEVVDGLVSEGVGGEAAEEE